MSRYDVHSAEAQMQPGGEEGVLLNTLGLLTKQDIDDAETELLAALYQRVFDDFPENLSVAMLIHWHKQWLGNLYSWAGQLRGVNMSKGNFHFAAAAQIPRLLDDYEQNYFGTFDSLADMDDEDVILFLAQSHVEFILIHPFREGNGRLSRLLMDVLSVKAGFQPLDYELWDKNKEFYFRSIQAGVNGDYRHLERLISDVLGQQN